MNLYRVWNGWVGAGAIRVLVVASDEDRARELATDRFRERAEAMNRMTARPDESMIGESYWTDLDVEVLTEGLDEEWAGEVSE